MKVMHLPFGYYPDPVGGTEVYVHGLARGLAELGLENVVCAPGPGIEHYEYDGLAVWRFAVSDAFVNLRDLYGEGDDWAVNQFRRILEAERPDVIHLHAFTMGVSLKVLRAAKRRGCRTVLTYHTPTVSCPQGTLMRDDRRPCDGQIETVRCSRCVARHWGLDSVSAFAIGTLPARFGRVLGNWGLQGGVWTALRCSELIELRQKATRQLFQEVDHIIAVCEWVQRLLLRNGVPPGKMTLCRQGVPCTTRVPRQGSSPGSRSVGSPLRLAYLGRLHPTKGVDDLVAALRSDPRLEISLDIYGVAQDASGQAYLRALKAAAGADQRIRLCSAVPGQQVPQLLRRYDLLAVPSRTFETGPLVVLDAFAAGVPVIGSNLGGVNELVRHEVNGLLVSPPAISGWASALKRCVEELDLLPRLRAGIQPPRTTDQVAREMSDLYHTLC